MAEPERNGTAAARRLGSILAAMSLAATQPASAAEDSVSSNVTASPLFMVKNNTSSRLTCRFRINDGAWSGSLTLTPGSALERRGRPSTTLYLFCEAPVRRIIYAVHRGERYSLLRAQDGWVELRQISARG